MRVPLRYMMFLANEEAELSLGGVFIRNLEKKERYSVSMIASMIHAQNTV